MGAWENMLVVQFYCFGQGMMGRKLSRHIGQGSVVEEGRSGNWDKRMAYLQESKKEKK